MPNPSSETDAEAGASPGGPPWMGPLVARAQYDRQWLLVYVLLMASAMVFFGWRGVFQASLTALTALGVFVIVSVPLRIVRGRWGDMRVAHVLNMGLLMGLTLPVTPTLWLAVRSGAAVGLLAYVIGPARRFRIHPVAAAQVLIVLPTAMLFSQPIGLEAVLTPLHAATGDVGRMERAPEGVAYWLAMPTLKSADGTEAHAVMRRDPSLVMSEQQRTVLISRPRLPQLLRERELVRMVDVIIGCRPGAVGLTSTSLVIVLGLWLVHRRLSRWPVMLAAVVAAVWMLAVLPVEARGAWTPSMVCFANVGWQVTVAYIGYQLLATPLLPIVMILAPLTLPRSATGRLVFGALVGAGVVGVRWVVPHDGAAYLALVVAGLLVPALDRMRRSRFVDAART